MTVQQAAILGFHFAGMPVGAIVAETGADYSLVRDVIQRTEQYILPLKRVAMLSQKCSYYDSCRDCTFPSCRMNMKMTVAMV